MTDMLSGKDWVQMAKRLDYQAAYTDVNFDRNPLSKDFFPLIFTFPYAFFVAWGSFL